MGLMTAA